MRPLLRVLLCAAFFMLPATLSGAEENQGPTEGEIAAKRQGIVGSKHDLTSLNQRAGADAMGGVAYTNYGDPCVYCHLPSHTTPKAGSNMNTPDRIGGRWNRLRPVTKGYTQYSSPSLKSAQGSDPGEISLLCLSCHDGTMAVDRVVSQPYTWSSGGEATLHMRLNASNDLQSCGKCHDGRVAHDMRTKVIGTDLRDVHPISIPYAGLDLSIPGFKAPRDKNGFANGVKLFNGMIECATCHDIHKADSPMLLRTSSDLLCITCHNN